MYVEKPTAWPDGMKSCGHPVRIESLESDLKALAKEYPENRIAQLPQAVKSYKSNSADGCKLKVGDLSSHNLNRIQSLYHRDFEKLGYSKDLPARTLDQHLARVVTRDDLVEVHPDEPVGLDEHELEDVRRQLIAM